jgi:hypothetical protein
MLMINSRSCLLTNGCVATSAYRANIIMLQVMFSVLQMPHGVSAWSHADVQSACDPFLAETLALGGAWLRPLFNSICSNEMALSVEPWHTGNGQLGAPCPQPLQAEFRLSRLLHNRSVSPGLPQADEQLVCKALTALSTSVGLVTLNVRQRLSIWPRPTLLQLSPAPNCNLIWHRPQHFPDAHLSVKL